LRTVIPLDVALAESPADKQHIYQKNSTGKGAKAYEALLDELERNQLIASKNQALYQSAATSDRSCSR
jgi:cellulose biosynthesis protein BcsQ